MPLSRLPLVLLLLAVARCAPDNSALEFQVAVQRMSAQLIQQFQIRTMAPLAQLGAAVGTAAGARAARDVNAFVIDPFIDGDSGNVTGASTTIAEIVGGAITTSSASYHVLPLSSVAVRSSRYVVTGTTKYEAYGPTGRKLYHIYGSIVDLDSGQVVASAANWVADPRIDEAPTPFYRNSPMYLKDATVNNQLQIAQGTAGPDVGRSYVRSLQAAAITNEGATALERTDYRGAAQLFNTSLREPDGQTMKNYSGLYQAYYRLSQTSDAERAFFQLFSAAVENNNVKIKFLFAVASTEFVADPGLHTQYEMWLRQIAHYLTGSQVCMLISGHASHTGTAEYNMKLSLERAQRIEGKLTAQVPALGPRLSAVGRGFEENIVGSGTDDDQDAVDRRVEFRPRPCQAA